MLCRIIDRKEGVYFVTTENGVYAQLYVEIEEQDKMNIGDFIETSVLSYDDIYSDVYVIFERKVEISQEKHEENNQLFFLPCLLCKNRMRKEVSGCVTCEPTEKIKRKP